LRPGATASIKDGPKHAMEANSIHDGTSAATGTKPAVTAEVHPEQLISQNISNRTGRGNISPALAAARAETSTRLASGSHSSSNSASASRAASVRFPGEDGGHSLAEMAQRDLDAALQLLADRAQYITGASGAAIAIRRHGRNDMLCRASAGMNAPELGALLSTEFGLSGESVRTRQALRCDDAERDKRVNREVCREMGIASVVVMPVVNDDEVLGVFELFSGKANAFGARDVSAVQRLSEMVETAVRLAQAAENLPERLKLKMSAISGMAVEEVEVEVEVLEGRVPEAPVVADFVLKRQVLQDPVLQDPVVDKAVLGDRGPAEQGQSGAKAPVQKEDSTAALEALRHPKTSPETFPVISPVISPETSAAISPETFSESSPKACSETSSEANPPKKTLFWSAALNPAAEADRAAEEPDQSHVPPVLRSLRKCEACGFPVSAGRMLCVECEEKKWRGQLKPASRKSATLGAAAAVTKPVVEPEVRAFAAAQSAAGSAPAPATHRASVTGAASAATVPALVAVQGKPKVGASRPMAAASASKTIEHEAAGEPAEQTLEIRSSVPSSKQSPVPSPAGSAVASPEFVLSAGLEPPGSWLAANKYIVGVLLLVAAAVAITFLLR
jgi:GAF domain-containing protein